MLLSAPKYGNDIDDVDNFVGDMSIWSSRLIRSQRAENNWEGLKMDNEPRCAETIAGGQTKVGEESK